MASVNVTHQLGNSNAVPGTKRPTGDLWAATGIAGAVVLVHLLTNGRYGFHRDELQVLADARHMDWGFVAYPPFTPLIERLGMSIFGLSMVGLRLFSVIAQALIIVIASLMARELGGGRLAQVSAALSVALAPLLLFEGTQFQYTSFDNLWWALIAYFVIRLLNSEDPRWWLAIGATIGIGLQTKYTMAFFTCGVVAGVIFTQARRYLMSKWLWMGVGLSILIFLPNLIWQVKHGFISLHFLQHIHTRDVGEGRADGFLLQQFWLCTNAFTVPLWIAGLIGYLRSSRYRMLAWMYLIPLGLYIAGKGRSYYLGGAYPMLLAMGAVAGGRWVMSLSKWPRRVVETIFFVGVVQYGLALSGVLIPWSNAGALKEFALKQNGDLREEIGWEDLVKTVAGIRDSLPQEQQKNVGIVVRNYGEAGAIEILGPAYHLPTPISGTNSAWLRSYPDPPPQTLIVMGTTQDGADYWFTGCRVIGHNGNSQGVENEESRDHPDIFLCGPPKLPWPEFWKQYLAFG
jgi:hypothetical protein